ncbi:MAG: hypothetical protein ACK56F_23050, partial [bacterium]
AGSLPLFVLYFCPAPMQGLSIQLCFELALSSSPRHLRIRTTFIARDHVCFAIEHSHFPRSVPRGCSCNQAAQTWLPSAPLFLMPAKFVVIT